MKAEYYFRPAKVVILKGNHEDLAVEGQISGSMQQCWLGNGGVQTLQSYENSIPQTHLDFMRDLQIKYEEGRYFFCHAEINPFKNLNDQTDEEMLWGRTKYKGKFLDNNGEECDTIVVHGHTPNNGFALVYGNTINLDSGSHWTGVLTCSILSQDKDPEFLQTGKGYVKYG